MDRDLSDEERVLVTPLATGPKTGFQLTRERGPWHVGTAYVTLCYLEERGHIVSDRIRGGSGARIYQLTDAGREALGRALTSLVMALPEARTRRSAPWWRRAIGWLR